MASPDANDAQDEGDEDDRAGHGNNDVEPEIEVGTLWYSANLFRISGKWTRLNKRRYVKKKKMCECE